MSSKRKFQRRQAESPAETSYRVGNEAHTRELADLVKSRIHGELSFVLITATIGEADARFKNMAYVSTLRREDSARLLTEMVSHWLPSGIVAQPTQETATVMREAVHRIRQSPPEVILENIKERYAELLGRDAAFDRDGVGTTALFLACEALALFDLAVSCPRDEPEPGSEPAPADVPSADQLAEIALAFKPGRRSARRGDTKTTLVADLETKPQSAGRDRLIELAKAGTFHDYDSEIDAPKISLCQALRSFGYDDLAQNVIDGHYDDETPTVAQQEEMRAEIGPETYDAMMGDKGRGKA